MAGHIDEIRSTTSGGTLPFPTAHDRLMTELESSEGQLGAIIRYERIYNFSVALIIDRSNTS